MPKDQCLPRFETTAIFSFNSSWSRTNINIYLLLQGQPLNHYNTCNYKAIKSDEEIKELSILINFLKCLMKEISTVVHISTEILENAIQKWFSKTLSRQPTAESVQEIQFVLYFLEYFKNKQTPTNHTNNNKTQYFLYLYLKFKEIWRKCISCSIRV